MESSSPGLRDEAFPPPNQPSPPTQSTLCPFAQEQNQPGATVLPLPLDQQRDEQEPWSLAQLPSTFSSIAAHSDDRPPMRNDGGCSGSDEAKEKATEDEHAFPLLALPISEEQGRNVKHGAPKFHKPTFDDQTFVEEAVTSTQAVAKGGAEEDHVDNGVSCYGGSMTRAEFILADSEPFATAARTNTEIEETTPVDNKQTSDVELVDHDESKEKRWEFDEETERYDRKHSHAEFIQDQVTAGTGEREISTQSDRHVSMKSPSQEIGETMLAASVDDNHKGESDSNLDDEWVEGSDSSEGDESDEGSYYAEDDESEGGTIRFQALCESLRDNDPCITRVADLFHYIDTKGLGRPLGNALLCNTHVSHITLDTTIAYNADHYFDPQEVDDILSFLRRSKSLRSFHGYLEPLRHWGPEVTTLWMDALAESLHIEEFRLLVDSPRQLCPDAVLRLYQTTKSLRRLELPLCLYEDHERHFDAIRDMTTLESLVFSSIGGESSPQKTAHMIRNLPCPVNLRSMGLGLVGDEPITPFPVTEAVTSFVRQSTTLTAFILTQSFDEEGILLFLESLHSNQSIAKLHFDGCSFTDEAIAAFVLFMQEETNGVQTTGIISFRWTNDRSPEVPAFQLPVFQLTAGPRGSRGRCLESLDVKTAGSWTGLEALAELQSPRLSHLKMEHTSGHLQHYQPLFRFLPAMVYLRNLELVYDYDLRIVERDDDEDRLRDQLRDQLTEDLEELLGAIRENGSLHSFALQRREVFSNLSLDVQPWTPEQARLVEAYGQRNQHMPELLSSAACQSCFTTLFLVARDTPRMTLHHVFTGVVTMHDSIGETTATRSDGTLPDAAAIGD